MSKLPIYPEGSKGFVFSHKVFSSAMQVILLKMLQAILLVKVLTSNKLSRKVCKERKRKQQHEGINPLYP